jgi:hypothetical protein
MQKMYQFRLVYLSIIIINNLFMVKGPMIQDFDGVEDSLPANNKFSIWKIVLTLLLGFLVLFVFGIVISLVHGVRPTVYNMLNENVTIVPFIVTSINLLQAAHLLVSIAVFYRSRKQAFYYAWIQMVLSTATHVALLVVLGMLPILGWSQHWASLVAVVLWLFWEFTVLLALGKVYKYRPLYEKRYLNLGIFIFVFYTLGAVAYLGMRLALPLSDTVLLLTEALLGVSAIAFVVILLVHTKQVYFTVNF